MIALPPLASRDRIIDVAFVVCCGIGQAAAATLAAFATRDAFAALHGGGGPDPRTLVELAGAGLLAAVCLYGAHRRSEALGQSYANALRRRLYRHIAALPKALHERRRVGSLSLRFVGDLSAARLWFGTGLPDVLTAPVVLPSAAAILFTLDPALAPTGVAPIGAALIVMIAVAWHLEARHKFLRTRRASIAIAMIERITRSPELDLMGRTDRELRSLDKQGMALRQDAVARRSRTAGLQAILQVGTAFAGLALLWRAGQTGAAPGTVAASLAVLALIALPLQNLAVAWDRYCAWRVARGKALRLLATPTIERVSTLAEACTSIEVTGTVNGEAISQIFPSGGVSTLSGPSGSALARHIAGLDRSDHLFITFNERLDQPKTAYIGDDFIGLQGSLRRVATLLNRKRPDDRCIQEVLAAYGLDPLLKRDRGLDTRIAEAGRTLTTDETLRLDLARAELGKVRLLILDSVRLRASPHRKALVELFSTRCDATILVVEGSRQLMHPTTLSEPYSYEIYHAV
jgi:ABC-type multidrug transport system fused ATPase/permease subunit